jgi:hypothetical protein
MRIAVGLALAGKNVKSKKGSDLFKFLETGTD